MPPCCPLRISLKFLRFSGGHVAIRCLVHPNLCPELHDGNLSLGCWVDEAPPHPSKCLLMGKARGSPDWHEKM